MTRRPTLPFFSCLLRHGLRWFLAFAVVAAQAQIFDEETLKEQRLSQRARDAEATVVVYNSADRDSVDLAHFYAGQRGISDSHLIGLRCPTEEEITRAQFDRDIAGPLRQVFVEKGWWDLRLANHPLGRIEKSSVNYLVLMRGMPLRIAAQTEPYPGNVAEGPALIANHNEAAVDSELSVLGLYSSRISGAINNPYYRSYTPIGGISLPAMLLVARLDGPTPAIVRRMILDSIAAEKNGLHGFVYVDARGTADPGLKLGDEWLKHLADHARESGIPVILDTGELLFPAAYPMQHVALYFGWYNEHVAGPFTQPGFRFEPGAVAVHIHSFSATTLRSTQQQWCGPLLAVGAAATLGNVYEPYLALTPELDVFYDRLQAGFTFAEAAYMSQRSLSWMTTVIGDPLYRPFPGPANLSPPDLNNEWEAYANGARIWYRKDRAAGAKALEKSAERLKSGVIMEGLGLLQLASGDPGAAVKSFERADRYYKDPADRIRVSVHEAFQLAAIGRKQGAIDFLRGQIARYSAEPETDVLRMMLAAFAPPPPSPKKPGSAAAAAR